MPERPEWRDILVGIGVAFFMNIAFVFLCLLLLSIGSYIAAIGSFTALLSYGIMGIG